MPTRIDSLAIASMDFTCNGPQLNTGYKLAQQELDSDRTGFLRIDVLVPDARIPVIMRREDLYVLGFQAGSSWWKFSDADWPLTPDATSLGHDGQYDTLGGLSGSLSLDSIAGVAKLADLGSRSQWKPALRTLLVLVAENLRLIPVQMRILGLLNGIQYSVPLADLERYIKNWGKASKGFDMSQETRPGLRQGFSDPTIIRR